MLIASPSCLLMLKIKPFVDRALCIQHLCLPGGRDKLASDRAHRLLSAGAMWGRACFALLQGQAEVKAGACAPLGVAVAQGGLQVHEVVAHV